MKVHYIGEVKHQVTNILGHLTVLGAPIKLATTVGSVATTVGTGVNEIINYDFFDSSSPRVCWTTSGSPFLTIIFILFM